MSYSVGPEQMIRLGQSGLVVWLDFQISYPQEKSLDLLAPEQRVSCQVRL